jgi:hypothetical protein
MPVNIQNCTPKPHLKGAQLLGQLQHFSTHDFTLLARALLIAASVPTLLLQPTARITMRSYDWLQKQQPF